MVNLYGGQIITTKADIWVRKTVFITIMLHYDDCMITLIPMIMTSVLVSTDMLDTDSHLHEVSWFSCLYRPWVVCSISCATSRFLLGRAKWLSVTEVSLSQTTPATPRTCTVSSVSSPVLQNIHTALHTACASCLCEATLSLNVNFHILCL